MRTVRLVRTSDVVIEIYQEDLGENDILEDLTEEELYATAWDIAYTLSDYYDWTSFDTAEEEI